MNPLYIEFEMAQGETHNVENALYYAKNKNALLFTQLLDKSLANLSVVQNYTPLYEKFFALNETNADNINLQLRFSLSEVLERSDVNPNIFKVSLQTSERRRTSDVYIKFSPLLDPIKYLTGSYDDINTKSFILPHHKRQASHPKLDDPNNCAYIDAFFTYLSSQLKLKGFVHGIHFYGTFTGIQTDYLYNMADDIEFITKSDYFHRNLDKLFEFQDCTIIPGKNSCKNKSRIIISDDIKDNSLDVNTCDEHKNFDTIFEDIEANDESVKICELKQIENFAFELDVNKESSFFALHDDDDDDTSDDSEEEFTDDDDDTGSEQVQDQSKNKSRSRTGRRWRALSEWQVCGMGRACAAACVAST